MKPPQKKFGKVLNNVRPQLLLSDLSHAISLERFGPKLFEGVAWRGTTRESRITLTFDDGPHAQSTPEILEVLNRFEVPAAFFLVGKHIESRRSIAEEIAVAGHEIGNHTFSHSPLYMISDKRIRDEIERTDALLRSVDGVNPRFFRPPAGLFTKKVLDIAEEMGYVTVVGDVYPRDPHLPGTDRIVERVLDRTTPGSIIILHDGGNAPRIDRSQTRDALSEIIPRLKEMGFAFVSLSELLID